MYIKRIGKNYREGNIGNKHVAYTNTWWVFAETFWLLWAMFARMIGKFLQEKASQQPQQPASPGWWFWKKQLRTFWRLVPLQENLWRSFLVKLMNGFSSVWVEWLSVFFLAWKKHIRQGSLNYFLWDQCKSIILGDLPSTVHCLDF